MCVFIYAYNYIQLKKSILNDATFCFDDLAKTIIRRPAGMF